MINYDLSLPQSWQRCHWESREGQLRRLSVLLDMVRLDDDHRSILDFGCGDGEMFKFAEVMGLDYLGVDKNPDMVVKAKDRFPQATKCFLFSMSVPEHAEPDYILASGVFNEETGNNDATIREILPYLYEKATLGVAVNFLDADYPHRHPSFHMYDKREMLEFCRTFCPLVGLRMHYLPNDFTIYLYR